MRVLIYELRRLEPETKVEVGPLAVKNKSKSWRVKDMSESGCFGRFSEDNAIFQFGCEWSASCHRLTESENHIPLELRAKLLLIIKHAKEGTPWETQKTLPTRSFTREQIEEAKKDELQKDEWWLEEEKINIEDEAAFRIEKCDGKPVAQH